MREQSPKEHFESAKKLGMKEYSNRVSNGEIGYLPSLEGIIKETEIVSHVDLDIMEIPLKKVVGTYSHLRSLSFSNGFMPILENNTEFMHKWESLCKVHLEEGIRDPIKVYEYLNWFYVVEGNKRVSVLKYFDAYSVTAHVTRLIPKLDNNNKTIQIYYEFLKFYNITKINTIWFSKRNSFEKLTKLLDKYNPILPYYENKYKHFEVYIYNIFRRIYYSLGSDKLPITTGDAYLEYARIYGIHDELDENELKKTIRELIKELKLFQKDELVDIQTTPIKANQGNMISTLTTFIMPPKKLKVAFVYARTIETSGWTYGHDLGRQYLEDMLGDQITTTYIENVPENGKAFPQIQALAEDGNDIIFTTSPVFKRDTLRCALKYPNIKFFNCSEYRPYKHMSNYYGRTYEPRFLTGIIAGSLTKTNILGYAATSPTHEVISCINAFAIGAKMVNPYAKVKVTWTKEWNSHDKFKDADKKLIEMGADIISNRNLTVPRDVTEKFGVYSMLCSVDTDTKEVIHHLAAPIWRWGIFYESIVKNVLNDTYRTIADLFGGESRLVNFWWGIASGALDIYYSKKYVPLETQKLVDLMRKMIINNDYNPFVGPIYDNEGNLVQKDEEVASSQDILKMTWFHDNVEPDTFTK